MVEADGRNLVLVLSTPRAGSTLLAAMLGSHPDVFAPPEPWLLLPLWALTSESTQIIAAYDDQLARHAVRAIADPATLSRASAAFAATIYNAALAPSAKRIFVDKTPRYYHLTTELDAIVPRAKKIWILRNPLDVIASCRDTWHLPLDELLGDAISPHSFDATIAFPLLATYFARQTAEQIVVRYEDLAGDAPAQLARICAHIGVAFDPALLLGYQSNTALMESYATSPWGDKKMLAVDGPETVSVGRWRNALAPADVRHVLMTLGTEIFDTLGYATELQEAAAVAGVSVRSLPARGRLDELTVHAAAYALRHLPESAGGRRTRQVKVLTDLQHQLAQEQRALAHPIRRWLGRLGLGRLFAARQP